MLLHNMMKAGAADDKLAIEDVFSAYVYQGNGSTQTINNGIDLAGKGGMVWEKRRSATSNHRLFDTVRGYSSALYTDATLAQDTADGSLTGFNSDGFSLSASTTANATGSTYASWTFRRAPKFFDVVQFTAGSSTNRRISHSLGCEPGMIILKRTDGVAHWFVYHRSQGRDGYAFLSTTGAFATQANIWGASDPTSTDFGIDETAWPLSGTYIAYLFAHDDTADGVIQCGSFTADGSGNATVNLGWEPQYILTKSTRSITEGYGNWCVTDTARGLSAPGGDIRYLCPNTANAENGATGNILPSPTATGFSWATSDANWRNQTFIYLAIRKGPMRVPTDPAKVFKSIARTGTGAAATVTGVGFAPDVHLARFTSDTFYSALASALTDRLRGAGADLATTGTGAEGSGNATTSFNMDGVSLNTTITANGSTGTYINYFFRRAPGFFDQVCYTGTGVARTIAHNLGSVPGMIWVKSRSNAFDWQVYHKAAGAAYSLFLTQTAAKDNTADYWSSTDPTSGVFSLGAHGGGNYSASTYTAYLFGDTPGLCKAGSYAGNGTNQDITLGFAPRFIIIKRTDAAGNWFVVDSVRGIVSGNDPLLKLNSTAAEVTTTDPIDPIANGFNITQEATNNLNVNGATYIYWASA